MDFGWTKSLNSGQPAVDWRAERKSRPANNRPGTGTTTYVSLRLLSRKICAEQRTVIVRKDTYQCLAEVIRRFRRRAHIALLVDGAALFDVVFKAVVKILLFAPFRYLRLVVQLDFINQQLCEALRFLVNFLVLGRQLGPRNGSRCGCGSRLSHGCGGLSYSGNGDGLDRGLNGLGHGRHGVGCTPGSRHW